MFFNVAMLRHALFSRGLRGLPRRTLAAFRFLPRLAPYLVYRLSFGRWGRSAPHRLAVVGLRDQEPDACGMISPDERAYFYAYARQLFTGTGEIVDLGCWLGATTISLAAGLAANPRRAASRRRVHAYDRFIWEAWMDGVRLLGNPPIVRRFRSRDSFLGEFHERIERWKDRIAVHPADLLAEGWRVERPIEFLLVDAMKSWDLTSAILRSFFPWLVPGRSVVVYQDFAFWGEPWVHLINYRLRQYFSPLYHVPASGSMVFELRRHVPVELLSVPYSYDSFSPDEVDAAIEYSATLVAPDVRPDVLAVKALIHVHRGDLEGARRQLDTYRSQGIPFTPGMRAVAQRAGTEPSA